MMIMTKRLIAGVIFSLMATSTAAIAEDDLGLDSGDAATAGEQAVQGPETLVSDEEARTVVWGDESIYVVQQRAYSKKGHFELTPFFLTGINPKFVGYLGGGLSAAYHLRENFSVEFASSLPSVGMFPFYSALVYEVYQYEGLTPEEVDLKQLSYFGALSAQYSALYGKFDIYGILLDYDLYLTAGAGLSTTVETCTPNRDGCGDRVDGLGFGHRAPLDNEDYLKLSGHLGAGVRIFFTDRVGVRVEVRDIVYADHHVGSQGVTTDIRNTMLLFLGASFLL
ncbi:MAG: outer membrane beta-barrel domain-containing protein [Myxococcota bacterium]|nr:outer membrane beta-barrel domain-containing protein [Myxococcota bacterium]